MGTLARLIKLEFKHLFSRKEFYYTFSIMIILSASAFLIFCGELYGRDISELYPANQIWMSFSHYTNMISGLLYFFLLPIVASVPFSDTFYCDKSCGVYKVIFTRYERKLYVFAKGIVVVISAFFIIFIPLLANQLLSFLISPFKSPINITNLPSYIPIRTNGMLFPELYKSNPYIYNFVFMLIPSGVGSVLALVSYAVSFYVKKSRLLVVAIPAVVYILYNFLSSLLLSPKYALAYYLLPKSLSNMLGLEYPVFIMSGITILSVLAIIIRNFVVRDEI